MFIGNYLDHPEDAELPTDEHVHMHGKKGDNIMKYLVWSKKIQV